MRQRSGMFLERSGRPVRLIQALAPGLRVHPSAHDSTRRSPRSGGSGRHRCFPFTMEPHWGHAFMTRRSR
jgi:hypothetical protein